MAYQTQIDINPEIVKKTRAFLSLSETEFASYIRDDALTEEHVKMYETGAAVPTDAYNAMSLAVYKAKLDDEDGFKHNVLYDDTYTRVEMEEFKSLMETGSSIARDCYSPNSDPDDCFHAVKEQMRKWSDNYWRDNWGRVTDQEIRYEIIWTAVARELGKLGHPDYQDRTTLPDDANTVDDSFSWQHLRDMDRRYQAS